MFVRIEGRKIHYKRLGKGSAIIFVHGWGGSAYSLQALAKEASSQHSTFCIDLPGFGRSDPPPPHWGVEGYASLVAAFMRSLNLIDPLYVGHSFGGEIGLYLAATQPHLIKKLIVCASPFRRPVRISFLARLIKGFPHSHPLLTRPYQIIRNVYYRIFHRSSDLLRYPALESNFRKIIAENITHYLEKINSPTLILWGEIDTYVPVIEAYELERHIKRSTLSIFPGVGHSLPLSRPHEVWIAIREFLKST